MKCYYTFQVSVGKMKYDSTKRKGILDKSFTLRKVFINKNATYDSVVDRIRDEVFESGEMEGNVNFFSKYVIHNSIVSATVILSMLHLILKAKLAKSC